jgi:hypothetical protein
LHSHKYICPKDRSSASFISLGLIQANISVKILSQRNSHTFLFLSATLPKAGLDLKAASTEPVAQLSLLVVWLAISLLKLFSDCIVVTQQMVVWMVAVMGGLSVGMLKPLCKSNLIFEISNLVL